MINTQMDNKPMASPSDINQALLNEITVAIVQPEKMVALPIENDIQVDDLWQHIRNKMTFDIPQNKRLVSQRNWYIKHPSYLKRVAKRAEPFLYYIVQQLEANKIPVEMALLPIVESAFDPFAYSHGRASGMWQFVPATGTRFGMKQNWWYDGRRDVVASTKGAIAYLKYLNRYFDGDWLLALAAYNSGEGRVRRAVKKNANNNKPTDFWSLELPKETRAYVPKLLALADIISRPVDFNLELPKLANQAAIGVVDIGSQLDLAKAAKLAELTVAELQQLNPGFNRWSTAPQGPHYLVLPKNNIEQFSQKLASLDKKQRLAWQRYKIKSGDSLGKIAQQFNTDVAVIKQVNQIHGTQIRTGKYLLIPVASTDLADYVFSKDQRLATKQSRKQKGTKRLHIVKSGDTLWDISRAYNVNHNQLAKWNGMAPKDTLKLKQKLVIWQPNKERLDTKKLSNTPNDNAIIRNITYKVRRGDSFARIANKFNVSIGDIEQWNQLNRKQYLQPGQMIKLAVDITKVI
jgi:membrane-bound lytic murein transglycosylase D